MYKKKGYPTDEKACPMHTSRNHRDSATASSGERRGSVTAVADTLQDEIERQVRSLSRSLSDLSTAGSISPSQEELAAARTIQNFYRQWFARTSTVNRTQLLNRVRLERQLGWAFL
jgi:hypothetical protein